MTDEELAAIEQRVQRGDPLSIADMCDDAVTFGMWCACHKDAAMLLAEVLQTTRGALADIAHMSARELAAGIPCRKAQRIYDATATETPKAG